MSKKGESFKVIADRIFKNAPREVDKQGRKWIRLGPPQHPDKELRAILGEQSHRAKLDRLAKQSRENPSLFKAKELKPKKIK